MINVLVACALIIWLFGGYTDSFKPVENSGKMTNQCNDWKSNREIDCERKLGSIGLVCGVESSNRRSARHLRRICFVSLKI